MEKIPITFEHKAKKYFGYLNPLRGAGQDHVWQLILDGYFKGNLRYTSNGWVFDSNTMPELADFLGDYITAWTQ